MAAKLWVCVKIESKKLSQVVWFALQGDEYRFVSFRLPDLMDEV